MADIAGPGEAEFEKGLPVLVRTMRIITGGMAMSLLAFAGVAAFLYVQGPRKDAAPGGGGIVPILTAIHAVMVIVNYAVSVFLYEQQLKPGRPGVAGGPAVIIQTAEILRLAPREGAALLGLVTCLLAVLQGVAARQPAYLLNGLSTVLFWAQAVNNFPSEERYREIFRTKMQGR